MSNEEMIASLQKVYQNTLEFEPGQTVHIYIGGGSYTFKNVVSLKVNVVHGLVVVTTPESKVIFRNWDGIEVGKGQVRDFVVGPMP